MSPLLIGVLLFVFGLIVVIALFRLNRGSPPGGGSNSGTNGASGGDAGAGDSDHAGHDGGGSGDGGGGGGDGGGD